jgi:hypothetical protein
MAKKKDTSAENPLLRKAQEEVVRCQVERFHKTYNQYFNRTDTEKLVKFFFEKIYDLEAQDTIIQIAINTYDKVKNQLASDTQENLENLIGLNQMTHDLDRGMSNLLLSKGWKEGEQLSQEEFFALYKEFGHEEERRQQLRMSVKCMIVSYQLAHRPFNDMLLKAARGFAVIFGVQPLYDFVEEGYKATKIVKADVFNEFVDTVTDEEVTYLEGAF